MSKQTTTPIGQRLLSAITLIAMVLGMASFAAPQATSAAPTADQYLTGSAVDGNLRILVRDTGTMHVERYAGGIWQRQIYGPNAKGSRLYFNGSAYSLARESTWVMDGTLPTLVSNSTSGNTITTIWNAGSNFQITQKTTYNDGNSYYRLEWNITNVSGAPISDLRFFHGEDTYLSGGDNGAGWWDAVNTTIGVQKDVSGVLQRMYLQGITTPFAYDSINYSTARNNANNGALTSTVDSNESTDNGYALEWRNASLAAGGTWTIVAFERFTSGTSGSVYVIAPVSTDCNVGSSCDVTYQVSNPGGTAVDVNLSVTDDQPTWNAAITSHTNPATVPANGAISVVVQVSPPAGTPDGTMGNFTLTATPIAGGSAASDTAAVQAVSTAPAAPVITSPVTGTLTMDNTPTFTGTADPGTTVVTVTLEAGGTVCVATVQPDNTWSCTPSTALPDGEHTFVAVADDGSGNVSTPSDPVMITLDTTAPAIPTVTVPISGTVTNDDTPTFEGMGEPGGTVTIYDDEGGIVCTTTVNPDNSWSCTPSSPLDEGEMTYNVTVTDPAGNESDPIEVTITVDTTAPAAPVVTAPVSGTVITDPTLTFSGTAEVGTTVVTVTTEPGGTVVCVATVNPDGTWECTATAPISNGEHTFVATGADAAGNESAPSDPVTVTVEAAADLSVSVTDLTSTQPPDTVTTQTFEVCNNGTLPLTYTVSAGSLVGPLMTRSILFGPQAINQVSAPGGTVLLLASTASGIGTSSDEYIAATALGFTVEVVDDATWAAKTTEDFATYRALIIGDKDCTTGTSYLAAAEANKATWSAAVDGNVILIGADPGYHYSAIPAAQTLMENGIGFAGDTEGKTGLYAAYGCAYYNALVNTPVSFLSEIGSFLVGGNSWDDVHIVASHPALSGLTDENLSNWGQSTHMGFMGFPTDFVTLASQDNLTGPGNITFADGTNGIPYIVVRGEDVVVVGEPNVTGIVPNSGPASGGTVVTLTGTDLTDGTVTFDGVAATCTVDSDTQITCTTPPHAPGAVDVVVTTPSGSDTVVDGFTYTGNLWLGVDPTSGTVAPGTCDIITVTFDSTGLEEGVYTGELVIDSNDPDSPTTIPVTLTVSSGVPLTVIAPIDGSITSDTPTFAGTGEPGNDITVYDDEGGVICTTTVDPDGNWTCVPDASLTDGEQTFEVTQTDPWGNESAPVVVTITVDTTPVVITAPIITAPEDGDLTNDNTPTFEGIADAGTTVTVTLEDGTFVCAATVDAEGLWSCTPSTSLPDGELTFVAVSGDGAGNESDPSEPVTLTIDTVAPAPPIVTAPISGTVTSDTPTFAGMGEPGHDITVYDDEGNVICTTTVDPDGNWTCVPGAPLPDGEQTFEVTQKDPAGNESDPVEVTITVDTSPVVITPPIITAPISGTVTSDNTLVFEGIADAGTMLTVTLEDGTFVCATTVNPDGTWACTPGTPLPDGEHTFVAVSGDGAGNESDPSDPVMIKIDTVAPAPPVIITPSEGATTGSLPTFSGTAEPGSTVRVQAVGTMTYVICEAVTDVDGNWTCTPTTPLSEGEHTATAVAIDQAGNESAPDQVTFTVAPVQAQDDAYDVPEGIGSTLDVLANDSSASGGTLSLIAVGTPAHGTATIDGDTIVYTPTMEYLGTDSFTYTISDGTSEDSAQVTLDVLPVADLEVSQQVQGTISGLEIVIVAQNFGPRPANGAVISDTFPTILYDITWTCTASGGAVCPNASGNDDIEETLATFPSGGVVTYTVSALTENSIAFNTVTITPPEGVLDLDLTNNITTRQTLYRLLLPMIYVGYQH